LKPLQDLLMGISISPVGPLSIFPPGRHVVGRTRLIVDERAIPPAGRIGETEDLIGSVFVKDGKVSFISSDLSSHAKE